MNPPLADDLLKQHSLPELRLLQERLEQQSKGKQQELQSMVGSRYHDFIQSADAITVMREKSAVMGGKLASFMKTSMDVVEGAKRLLGDGVSDEKAKSRGRAAKQQQSSVVAPSIPTQLADPSPAAVWALLEKCSVFEAGVSVLLAGLLLNDKSEGAGEYLTISPSGDTDDAQKSPTQARFSAKSLREALVLRPTVVEDSKLVLLLPGLSAVEQARALAALGLVGGLRRAELLAWFFECASLQLSSVGDEAAVRRDDDDDSDDEDDDNDEDDDDEARGAQLVRCVQSLQRTIIDAHTIFFKPAGGVAQASSGLLQVHQHDFVAALLAALRARCPHLKVDLDAAKFDAKEIRSSGQAELRRVFEKWLAEAIRKVSDLSRAVLGSMQSAAQVARLQHLVFVAATTRSAPVAAAGADTQAQAKAQEEWSAASFDLLATPRLRARIEKSREEKTPLSDADDPTKLLWTTALRQPFMSQVERLLRSSCQGVVMRAREQVLRALEAEGVAADSFTLSVSVPSSFASPPSSSTSSSSSSSSSTFRRAERVRESLEEDLLDLLADIVHHPSAAASASASASTSASSSGGSSESAALSRAFYVQCSQLLAQFAVALRTLCSSLSKAQAAAGQPKEAKDKLAAGLLFVGRLAWLLKIRGGFLEETLSVPPSLSTAAAQLTTEDQLRSAFEIADTDGDGVVTYSEAVEAVQALAVGDSAAEAEGAGIGSDPRSGAAPFLSMLLTPSLNFGEMTMLCAHMLAPETCQPLARFHACAADLVTTSHKKWAERVVGEQATELGEALSVELGMEGHCHFRSFWRPATAAGDDIGDALIPTSCTHSLARFFLALNQRAAVSLVSIDTIQVPTPQLTVAPSPSLTSTSTSASSITAQRRLCASVLQQLHASAVAAAVEQYSSVLDTRSQDQAAFAKAHNLIKSSQRLLVEKRCEDCALQAAFDLLVVEAVASRCGVALPVKTRACVSGWNSRLDPINAELLSPLLRSAAAKFAAKTFLLFPGASAALPTPTLMTAAAAAEEDALTGIFSCGPQQTPCRFSLLPLAIATHGGSLSTKDDSGSSAGPSAGAGDKRGKKGVSKQTEQGGGAGQLGKLLGSILGAN